MARAGRSRGWLGGLATTIAALGVMSAACGTTPGPQAGTAQPSQGSAITATPATPRPTPPPTPQPASPSDLAVAGLVALATNPETTYQAAITGRSRHSADILPIEGTLQVTGANARIVADVVFPEAGGEGRVEVRAIDGEGWARYDSEPFIELGELGEDEAPNPFAGIDEAEDVTIVSDEPDADGYYQVELEGMVLHPGFIPASNLSEPKVNRTKLTLLIDERGRPVRGSWEMVGQGRISRQLQEIVMELDLTFSGLGSDITIARP